MTHENQDSARAKALSGPAVSALSLAPPLGSLTLGAMAVCVASGIVVMASYDPSKPLHSIIGFEVEHPYGWFFRGLHAWSGHLFFAALLAHTAEFVVRRADRDTAAATWATLTLSLPVSLYLMLSGQAMLGDAEAGGVAAVMRGVLTTVTGSSDFLADVLVGPTSSAPNILTTHHVASATLLMLALSVYHVRKVVPDVVPLATALGIGGCMALLVRPALGPEHAQGALYGPWFMRGLRLALEHVPVWIAAVAFPAAGLAALAALPLMSPGAASRARVVLLVGVLVYCALTVAAWVR